MTTDTLHCRCGGEVRVVRLNAQLLTFGHVRNPKSASHRVRIARSGDHDTRRSMPVLSRGPRSEGQGPRSETAVPQGDGAPSSTPRGLRTPPRGTTSPGRSVEPPTPRVGSGSAPSGSRST